MTEEALKTSDQWQAESDPKIVIVDPDGWDRSNFQYSFFEEKISFSEFERRMVNSSLIMGRGPGTLGRSGA